MEAYLPTKNRENEVFLPSSMPPPITKIQCIIGTNNGPCDLDLLGIRVDANSEQGHFWSGCACTCCNSAGNIKAHPVTFRITYQKSNQGTKFSKLKFIYSEKAKKIKQKNTSS
jgi:hypothetical protein